MNFNEWHVEWLRKTRPYETKLEDQVWLSEAWMGGVSAERERCIKIVERMKAGCKNIPEVSSDNLLHLVLCQIIDPADYY